MNSDGYIPADSPIPPLYGTEGTELVDKVVWIKLTAPGFTFYLVEYSPTAPDETPDLAFGYVHNEDEPYFSEWGYISIQELKELGRWCDGIRGGNLSLLDKFNSDNDPGCDGIRTEQTMHKDRAKAIEWARKVFNDNLVVMDTETTGVESTDEVVQLGVVSVQGGQPLVLLDALVRPVRATMHPKATAASGITDAMLKAAPTIDQYWAVLQHLLTGKTIVAYNAAFDEPKLRHSLRAVGHVFPFQIECAMLQYGAFDGEWNSYYGNYRWHKLTEACRSMGIPVRDAHVASGDCLMTLQLIKKMAESEG